MVWWQALINLISVFISLLLLVIFTYKSVEQKIKISYKNMSIIFAISILSTININVYTNGIRLLGNYLLEIIMFYFLDRKDWTNKIYYCTIIVLYGVVAELILVLLFSMIFSLESLNEFSYTQQSIVVIIGYIFWYGSWSFLIKVSKLKKILELINQQIANMWNFKILFILLFMAINVMFVESYNILENYLSSFALILIINILLIVIVVNLKNRYEKRNLERNNKHLEKSIKTYEKVAEDYKILKHNLISDFLIIKSVCPVKVQKLINTKIANYQKDYEWINGINNIPNGIKGLIYLKMEEAKNHNVKIVIECDNLLSNIKIKNNKTYFDLCESLEILLTNAIEATELCKEKTLKVIVKVNKNIFLRIMNPFVNNIDIENIGKKSYSTKNRSSGIGLYFLKKKDNRQLKISNKIINDIYITDIKLET